MSGFWLTRSSSFSEAVLGQRTAPPLTRIDLAGEERSRRTDEEAGDAAATSSGVPQRARGVSRRTRSCQVSRACSPQAVLIQPGAMALTRTAGARLRPGFG